MAQNWLCAVVLVPCFWLGLPAQDTKPAPDPKPAPEAKAGETVKVEAHRSKWDYPKEVVVPEGHRLHIVVQGDTFWGLGTKYLGSPYSWPQIWEKNKWIKDSHWIYPGDPILVDSTRTAVTQPEPVKAGEAPKTADLAPKEVVDLPPDDSAPAQRRMPVVTSTRVPKEELACSIQDYLRMPYLTEKGTEAYMNEMGALRIVGSQDPLRTRLSEGEVLYLNGGTDKGVKIGDRWLVIRQDKKGFYHPDDQRRKTPLGDILRNVGIIRITSVNPRGAIAVVERTMDGMEAGYFAVPYQEQPNMILRLRSDISSPVEIKDFAKIIFLQDDHERASSGEMLILDKGTRDGLKIGDILLGVRPRSFEVTQEKVVSTRTVEKTNYYLGQVIVVKVTETSATCRILRSVEEIKVGDLMTR